MAVVADLNSSGVVDVWRQENACKDFEIPCKQTLFFGTLLIFLQAADGILTSMGVSRFGTMAEGNPLLRVLMEQFGAVEVLAVAKLMAIFCVLQLMKAALKLSWVKSVMGGIACFYTVVAVIPWTYFLFFKPIIG